MIYELYKNIYTGELGCAKIKKRGKLYISHVNMKDWKYLYIIKLTSRLIKV